MSGYQLDIIIPTLNNPEYLVPCVRSLFLNTVQAALCRVIIVNNGHKDSITIQPSDNVKVIHAGENLGWEGGLNLGLQNSDAPFVAFANDDIFFNFANALWLPQMLSLMRDPKVAAVGPVTNVVMGMQNIYAECSHSILEAPFLIGFFEMLRRETLDAVGGVDLDAPGGDDIDLSIRFRKDGYKLLIDRRSFIVHHGFKTGERVQGGPDVPFGWNSMQMQLRTNAYLVRKHGVLWWWKTMGRWWDVKPYSAGEVIPWEDAEGDIVRSLVKPGKVVELGCGGVKTVPEAIGVDVVPKGVAMPAYHGEAAKISVADVVGDVSEKLPPECTGADTIIARHVLEHMIDPVAVLRHWRRCLKDDGVLILALPDESIVKGIPMNPEHTHAFTPESLSSLMNLIEFRCTAVKQNFNGISFVAAYEKSLREEHDEKNDTPKPERQETVCSAG